MNEREKKKQKLEKDIALGDNLMSLEGHAGWEDFKQEFVVKAIETADARLKSSSHVKNYNDWQHYHAVYSTLTKLLAAMEMAEKKGQVARQILEGDQRS